MTEKIGSLTLLEIEFDESGDVDQQGESAVRRELDAAAPTDLIVFSHGWNNSTEVARRLYKAFFGHLAPLVTSHAPDRRVVLLGVYWPSQRWSDEPIPDFTPSPDLGAREGGGAAGLGTAEEFEPPPAPGTEITDIVRSAFGDDQRAVVDELLSLLKARSESEQDLDRARELIGLLARTAGKTDDGEGSEQDPLLMGPDPQRDLFETFALALEDQGIVIADTGGEAGFGDSLKRAWNGAQEAARQLTYWQMKKRAGVVGERGLGPFLARLLETYDGLGLHLVGHSFGARAVSYALKALPDDVGGQPPVRGVTLLQGAFSHFAFAPELPFDTSRSGALRGQNAKVSGHIVACYSKYDQAVGTFYPLASILGRQDAAGVGDATYRWGGIGHDGHQNGVREFTLNPVATRYDFQGESLVNIDASRVVRNGKPPSGAHSDIVKDELAWVVLSAGALLAEGT